MFVFNTGLLKPNLMWNLDLDPNHVYLLWSLG